MKNFDMRIDPVLREPHRLYRKNYTKKCIFIAGRKPKIKEEYSDPFRREKPEARKRRLLLEAKRS